MDFLCTICRYLPSLGANTSCLALFPPADVCAPLRHVDGPTLYPPGEVNRRPLKPAAGTAQLYMYTLLCICQNEQHL